ncbi:hypothetical protein [Ureibacillus chungkukjangi]|uniref:YhfM-like domain-containing protein n=1 Tax=Ureibacillus chungkukjangi TaxID=1202712 RepID=A0A318TTY5_9BACL|nr:hypothetical protein [Ureibacillus chungkukjangi]PYF08331.1 hypothetical protein BJ095_10296 [Ureibacillus chungkukjangi]
MKIALIFLSLIGMVWAGCSHEERAAEETVSKLDIAIIPKENHGTINLELNKEEVVIFERAVKDSIKESGIVNMANPEFQFSIANESYFLWISDKAGTIMNTKDTHTIYTLSSSSIEGIYGFLNGN